MSWNSTVVLNTCFTVVSSLGSKSLQNGRVNNILAKRAEKIYAYWAPLTARSSLGLNHCCHCKTWLHQIAYIYMVILRLNSFSF